MHEYMYHLTTAHGWEGIQKDEAIRPGQITQGLSSYVDNDTHRPPRIFLAHHIWTFHRFMDQVWHIRHRGIVLRVDTTDLEVLPFGHKNRWGKFTASIDEFNVFNPIQINRVEKTDINPFDWPRPRGY